MTARPDLLATLPDVIAGDLAPQFPDLASCTGHTGRFNLADLRRDGIKAPAIRVSLLGARPADPFAGSVHTAKLEMAAYVITRDRPGLDRDSAALSIVQRLLTIVPDRRWGEIDLGEAENVTMQSLVSVEMKKAGVSLWAVTWRQPVVFNAEPLAEPLPIELYVNGEEL